MEDTNSSSASADASASASASSVELGGLSADAGASIDGIATAPHRSSSESLAALLLAPLSPLPPAGPAPPALQFKRQRAQQGPSNQLLLIY